MSLLIIGSVPCPIDSGHMVSAGISREGQGAAIHVICVPCSFNLQAKRSSPLGRRLVEEAHGRPATSEAISDVPHADEPEPTENSDDPETHPEETEPAVAAERPPDGDPYLANIP